MMKRRISLLALPLLSFAACLDVSDQDHPEHTSPQEQDIEPAAAPATGRVCETNGGQRCVGAPTIAFEDPVQETAGGRIFRRNVSGNQVKFPFNADPSKCVAVTNNGALVEVRACSVPSAVWILRRGTDGFSCFLQNQQFGLYLSGPNNAGQFHLETKHANGWLQQFNFDDGLADITCD